MEFEPTSASKRHIKQTVFLSITFTQTASCAEAKLFSLCDESVMRFRQLSNFRINGVNSQESFLPLYAIPDLPANIRVKSVVPGDGVQILVKLIQIGPSPECHTVLDL